jgi:hypothetical protein
MADEEFGTLAEGVKGKRAVEYRRIEKIPRSPDRN